MLGTGRFQQFGYSFATLNLAFPSFDPGIQLGAYLAIASADSTEKLTTLMSLQQPQQHGSFFFLYIRRLAYLKYVDSHPSKRKANSIPNMSSTNADKNCSIANGSLVVLCWCLPGLQIPAIQYFRNLSKSPER